MPVVRILIADDFGPWTRHICGILSSEPSLHVVRTTADGLSAVCETAALKPDVVLLDIDLPFLKGIEVARQIKQLANSPEILFVSQNREPLIVKAALDAGGSGYVLKSDAAEVLEAIRVILDKGTYLSRSLKSILH